MKDNNSFSTPILLLAFNRPDYVKKQITLLRKLRPKVIYFHVDGPRLGNENDERNCRIVRELISTIDWECQLHKRFNKMNLGCKMGVSSAINWFFEGTEEGIILEDDCLPERSFFPYCQELLKRYRHNDHIGMISGSNFFENSKIKESYFFSKFPQCWGWATWKRAWNKYDVRIANWRKDGRIIINNEFVDPKSRLYWIDLMEKMYRNKIDTWDYQWVFTCWKNKFLCIIPSKNLIKNIGFDRRATHTILIFSPAARQKTYSLNFPLNHPSQIKVNVNFDEELQKKEYERTVIVKLFIGIKKYLNI